jgi:hypothetical protein
MGQGTPWQRHNRTIRIAIQRSKAPLKGLTGRYGLNQKTVAEWRKHNSVHAA